MDEISVLLVLGRLLLPRFTIGLVIGAAAAGCVGALIVGDTPVRAIAGVVLLAIAVLAFRALRRWFPRRSRSVQLQIDGDRLELARLSSEDQARLLSEFLARHPGSTGSEKQEGAESASSAAAEPGRGVSPWQQVFAAMSPADQQRMVTEFLQRYGAAAALTETAAGFGSVTLQQREIPYWLKVASPLAGIVTGLGGVIIAVVNSR